MSPRPAFLGALIFVEPAAGASFFMRPVSSSQFLIMSSFSVSFCFLAFTSASCSGVSLFFAASNASSRLLNDLSGAGSLADFGLSTYLLSPLSGSLRSTILCFPSGLSPQFSASHLCFFPAVILCCFKG